MPGIDIAEPERTETSSGLAAAPKPLPVLRSSAAIVRAHVVHQPVGQPLVLQIGEAGRRRDDESGRNVETDLRHRAQVGALAAEQHPVAAVAFFERVDESGLAHGHLGANVARSLRAIDSAGPTSRRVQPVGDAGDRAIGSRTDRSLLLGDDLAQLAAAPIRDRALLVQRDVHVGQRLLRQVAAQRLRGRVPRRLPVREAARLEAQQQPVRRASARSGSAARARPPRRPS